MGRPDPKTVLAALREVLPQSQGTIPLHEPELSERELERVRDCLESGWVSSVGPWVERFEAELARASGVAHAVAVVNGTAALHVSLLLSGVGAHDEVLVPTLTFVATANAVAYCGAVPFFVDSEEKTLGVDPAKLASSLEEVASLTGGVCRNRRTGRRIAAVVPVHLFGHPVDMDPLLEVAERFRLAVVEDAAESLGTRYRGRPAGSLAPLAATSFNGNKIVTAGGGGAILTDDPELAREARHLTTTARGSGRWAPGHDRVGYNYRMPGLNAALAHAQLERLPRFLAAKRALARAYQEAFADVEGVSVFREAPFAESNYWLNCLLLDEPDRELRDELLEITNAAGIATRPAWTPMHQLPMYAGCPRTDLGVAESLEQRLINVPSSPALGEPRAA